MDVMTRVPVREQNPQVRAANFEEVCLGYNAEEAMAEAARCLNCKNAQCMKGCPVSINIPAFIAQVKEGNFEEAYHIISESSALPAVCGRVCPQENQCEGMYPWHQGRGSCDRQAGAFCGRLGERACH